MPRRPRVVYDGTIYHCQQRGGITRYFNRLIERLCGLEPTWQFYMHVQQRTLSPAPVLPNMYVIRQRHIGPRQLFFPINYGLLEWHRRRVQPALYHSTLYRPFRFAGCPIVSTIFDLVEERFPELYPDGGGRTQRWKRWTARHAAAILTISQQTRSDVVELLGVPPERVHVTYLAADPAFRPAQEHELRQFKARHGLDRPYLLYVGHRGEHKNFGVLVEAFHDPRLAEFSLLLVGGRPGVPELSSLPAAAASRVRHVRSMEDDELRLAYGAAEVLVFPSLWEGFGLPLLEAMACGTPVVGSDIPTTHEVCAGAAELFAARDPMSLVEAVLRATQSSRRGELVAAGLARASQFSWERCASETLRVYQRVLQS